MRNLFDLVLNATCFSNASAQEKCKISEGLEGANATYTQQHTLDVGDVAGHQIQIYEIHRTYPNDKPNCEGAQAHRDMDQRLFRLHRLQ
jgi:hypothetical protein